MEFITNIMIQIIDFFYGLTGSWGVTILALTLLIRLILLPLTIKSSRSSQAMVEMQPELDKIQKKYKDDPERLNLEIMEVYDRYGVNPACSCVLPVIQLPILLAMFRSLESHPTLCLLYTSEYICVSISVSKFRRSSFLDGYDKFIGKCF